MSAELPPLLASQPLEVILGVVLTVYIPFVIKAVSGLREEVKEFKDEYVKARDLQERRVSRLEAITRVLWAVDQKRRKGDGT